MADSSGGLWIELLGPVEAWVDGQPVALGGQRPRALFAILALMGGRVVSSDLLIDELWGEAPPARARDSLQMHVSRLRKGLANAGTDGGRLVSQAGGYLLNVRPGERDIDRWEAALGRARRAREAGQLYAAREGIEEAERVWRGQPLGGVSTHSLVAAERARLEEERLGAIIEGIELDLELGRHSELLGRLEALAIEHPFKERLVELQMLALHRSGRQADALAAFHAARRRLVDELGIEPAQPLRELHEDILKHSAELASPVGGIPLRLGLEPSGPLRELERSALTHDGVLEPPHRAASEPPGNLPLPSTRFLGRTLELAELTALADRTDTRLLTLTGTGGGGKTRLALRLAETRARDYRDGAWFVGFGDIIDPELIAPTICLALGLTEQPGATPAERLKEWLRERELLLLLDNLEQLTAGTAVLGELLAESTPSGSSGCSTPRSSTRTRRRVRQRGIV
jgi:DNA-binding SARP family transcriptional activator